MTTGWIEANYNGLRAYALSRYGQAGEDLVQQVCLRLLAFENPNPGLAYTIMRNLYIDGRKSHASSRTSSLDAILPNDDGDEDDGPRYDPGAVDPPAPLEVRRDIQALRQKMYRVMKQLAPEHRQVLELAVLGFRRHPGTTTQVEFTAAGTQEAAAAALGIPQGTAKTRFMRAKRAFRRAWERKVGRQPVRHRATATKGA